VGRTWNRGLLFQSEDNVEVIRGNGRQLSNAAYSRMGTATSWNDVTGKTNSRCGKPAETF
jgi:hypothetical protein